MALVIRQIDGGLPRKLNPPSVPKWGAVERRSALRCRGDCRNRQGTRRVGDQNSGTRPLLLACCRAIDVPVCRVHTPTATGKCIETGISRRSWGAQPACAGASVLLRPRFRRSD